MQRTHSLAPAALLLLAPALLASGAPMASVAASPAGTAPALALERCLELALARHPTLAGARGTLHVARSRAVGARANWLPQLSLTVARTQTEIIRQASGGGATVGAGGVVIGGGSSAREIDSDIKRAALNLRQTVTDFGRTENRVAASRHQRQAAGLDLQNAIQDVILGVEEAYFGLLAARSLVEVNRQTVSRASAYVELAEGLVGVGRRPRFDLTRAQVDLSNARVGLIQATNTLELARVTLANAMGLAGQLPGEPSERTASPKLEATRQQALETGLSRRADLASAREKLEAARASLRGARAGYRPTVSVAAGKSLRGEEFPLDRQTDVSVSVDWNLFDGYQTRAAVGEAGGQLEIASAQYELARQRVVAEVQQQHLNSQETAARVEATKVALNQANENLELARGRYREGVGSPIEVTDAELQRTTAETAHVRARYDYEIALARLQRAMGLIQAEEER